MLKIWGRNTSSNVQKAMWAIGEMGLACERIDIGGPFGKNREPAYLAMNPNGLVPTLEEDDGYLLWESNTIVRYLAAKHGQGTLEPTDLRIRANAQKWMDWQLSVAGPAIFPVFWGLIRTPPEKRDHKAIEDGKAKMIDIMGIVDRQLEKTQFLASDTFCYGDIPVGVIARRYFELIPDAPRMKALDRWRAALLARPPYREHVVDIPLS